MATPCRRSCLCSTARRLPTSPPSPPRQAKGAAAVWRAQRCMGQRAHPCTGVFGGATCARCLPLTARLPADHRGSEEGAGHRARQRLKPSGHGPGPRGCQHGPGVTGAAPRRRRRQLKRTAVPQQYLWRVAPHSSPPFLHISFHRFDVVHPAHLMERPAPLPRPTHHTS